MASVVITVLAAALIVFAVYQTVQKARGKSKMASCCGSGEPVRRKRLADRDASHYPYRYKLAIENMKCSNCAANVENALNDVEGNWAKVNLGKKEADVLSKLPRTEEDFAMALANTCYKVSGCTETA
jgi:copper chaperone CopZ